jgi:S-formylglutathione hydrolase FrmB
LLVLGALAMTAALTSPAPVPAAVRLAPGCPVTDAVANPGPYFVTEVVPMPPAVSATYVDNHVEVILPAGYCTSAMDYPVVYLLHGAGDTYQAWEKNTDLDSFVRAHQGSFPFIFVMPDGGHNADAGWYSDWSDHSRQYETYHITVLRNFVNGMYRTRPDDAAVAGLSMGGFGALSYAARHPGMFKVAASFSGAVDMLYGAPLSGAAFAQLHSQYGTPDARVWGDQTAGRQTWEAHNPASLAPKLAGTVILLASGTGTPGGAQGEAVNPTTASFDPGGYVLESFIFQMNVSLVRALTQAGVPYTADFYPGGYHGWPYWQADLHWALPLVARVLGGPTAG